MIADPEQLTNEDPIAVFDQLLQTCGVMTYCQAYFCNMKLTKTVLRLSGKIVEVRAGLAPKQELDKKNIDEEEIPLGLR